MKVLGIVCSPRVGGNTEALMEKALSSAQEAGAEVELLSLAKKDIRFCDGCETCIETGKCHINDDMQAIYLKLTEADGIILGTPVYFWTVTAQAKAFMDRTFAFFRERSLRDKVGATLIVARRVGASSAWDLINAFFLLHRMHNVAGTVGYGDKRGDVRQDERAMAEASGVGRVVVRSIKALRAEEK